VCDFRKLARLAGPAICAISLLAVPVHARAEDENAEKEVRETLEVLRNANVKGGPEAADIFDKYLTADFTRILPNGTRAGKAEVLESFRTGTTKVQSDEFSEIAVHIYGNTAIATGVVRARATILGFTAPPDPMRWTRVFVKRGDVWQCALNQTTKIAEAKQSAGPTDRIESAAAAGGVQRSFVASPDVYKVIGENEQYRVIEATWKPGQRDKLHSHGATVTSYALTDCKTRNHLSDGTAKDGERKAGSVQIRPADLDHSMENLGKGVCRLIIFEPR
jgi:ketosteroid isomerase-like protein